MTLADVMRQMIENALYSADISSAGGESPRINFVRDLDINPSEFDAIMESTIKRIVEETMQEWEPTTGGTKSEGISTDISALDVLHGVALGTRGSAAITGLIMKMIPFLGPILISAGIATFLFEWAKSPGGPLDTRYHHDIEKAVFNFMSRQLRRDTEIGHRQIIIQTASNFGNLGGAGNSNTFRQIRERGSRLADIGLVVEERARGLERLE